jgi:hypothetical protein
MFKFININIKNVFDELKLDINFIFNEIIHIPSMNALKRKYKDYNPVSKFFTPFMYINIPILQLIVISSASYYIYKMYVHFSSGSLASTLLEIIGVSLYLTSMGLFVRKYIKLDDTQNSRIELLGIFIISVFICVLIIYFNFPISFLLLVPFFLAKYFFKHYSNVKFSPRDKFKNALVQTLYAQSDRIKDLYAKKMFVSGFYSEFVLKQWLVVVIYSLVNTDVHESVLILHYGIMHIGFNIWNRTIGVLFGNESPVNNDNEDFK